MQRSYQRNWYFVCPGRCKMCPRARALWGRCYGKVLAVFRVESAGNDKALYMCSEVPIDGNRCRECHLGMMRA